MTFNEYQTLARRTQNPDIFIYEREMHALHGLSAEIGEINGIYQKSYQGHMFDVEKAVEEMGDVLWFMAELADVLDVPLEEVARRNIEKLRKRYPNGFDEDRSVNREQYSYEQNHKA